MYFPDYHLNLTITKSASNNYTELVLANTNHEREKSTLQRRFFFALLCYLFVFFLSSKRLHVGVHGVFILLLLVITFQLFSSVDKEVVKVVKDFGIEKSTIFSFNRQKQIFIQVFNIHKVVINEVIYFVSVNEVSWIFKRIESIISEPYNLRPPTAHGQRVKWNATSNCSLRCKFLKFLVKS